MLPHTRILKLFDRKDVHFIAFVFFLQGHQTRTFPFSLFPFSFLLVISYNVHSHQTGFGAMCLLHQRRASIQTWQASFSPKISIIETRKIITGFLLNCHPQVSKEILVLFNFIHSEYPLKLQWQTLHVKLISGSLSPLRTYRSMQDALLFWPNRCWWRSLINNFTTLILLSIPQFKESDSSFRQC